MIIWECKTSLEEADAKGLELLEESGRESRIPESQTWSGVGK